MHPKSVANHLLSKILIPCQSVVSSVETHLSSQYQGSQLLLLIHGATTRYTDGNPRNLFIYMIFYTIIFKYQHNVTIQTYQSSHI